MHLVGGELFHADGRMVDGQTWWSYQLLFTTCWMCLKMGICSTLKSSKRIVPTVTKKFVLELAYMRFW